MGWKMPLWLDQGPISKSNQIHRKTNFQYHHSDCTNSHNCQFGYSNPQPCNCKSFSLTTWPQWQFNIMVLTPCTCVTCGDWCHTHHENVKSAVSSVGTYVSNRPCDCKSSSRTTWPQWHGFSQSLSYKHWFYVYDYEWHDSRSCDSVITRHQ